MRVLDLYSHRKRVADGNAPDVFTYDELPSELRVQVAHIWSDAIGNDNAVAWKGTGPNTTPGPHRPAVQEDLALPPASARSIVAGSSMRRSS